MRVPALVFVFSSSLLFALSSTVSDSRSLNLPRQRYPDYQLRASVVNDQSDCGSDKEDLFVMPYLVGPGLSDAVLGDSEKAPKFWLNGTYEESDFVANATFGLTMIYTPHTAWSQVQVDAGFGSPGFYFDVSGLQWRSPDYFGGWLACDWNHNAPQLFWIQGGIDANYTIPSSCSVVNIVAEH